MNAKILINAIAIAVVAFMVFLLVEIVGVDIIGDVVESTIAAGDMPAMSIVNVILVTITLAWFTAATAATILIYRSRSGWLLAALSIGLCGAVFYTIALLGLYTVPAFTPGIDNIALVPAIWFVLVIRDPNVFVGILGTVHVGSNIMVATIMNIQ